MTAEEMEDFLVQSAMMRIERAQARGRSDVNLSKEELAALERRRERLEEEAERRERKKRRQQRVAVPLSHLEPVSRKKRSGQVSELSSQLSSRQPSASDLSEVQERQGYPPMGYFPPPSASRTRTRAVTSASQRPTSRASDRESSFNFEYVQRPSTASNRHVSEGNRNAPDPFQFQTEGPSHTLRSSGSTSSSRRQASGPEVAYVTRRRAEANRSSLGRSVYDETSEDGSVVSEQERSSDDYGNGARIRELPRSEIVVEAPPELEHEPPKKKSSESLPPKRKSVVSTTRGGRRKKK